MAGRSAGVVNDCRSHVTALSPTANTMFSMAVWRGTVAGPLHWRAGWQTGSLARPIALNAYFYQENSPLVNYPNETMSSLPLTAHYAPTPPLTTHSSSFMSVDGGTSRRRWEVSRGRSRPAAKDQVSVGQTRPLPGTRDGRCRCHIEAD